MNNVFDDFISDEMKAYFDGEYMDHSIVRDILEVLVATVISEANCSRLMEETNAST